MIFVLLVQPLDLGHLTLDLLNIGSRAECASLEMLTLLPLNILWLIMDATGSPLQVRGVCKATDEACRYWHHHDMRIITYKKLNSSHAALENTADSGVSVWTDYIPNLESHDSTGFSGAFRTHFGIRTAPFSCFAIQDVAKRQL